jgi:hypothetical protein
VGLASRVSRCAEVGGGGPSLGEVAGEDWLDEGAEDNLGAASFRQYLAETNVEGFELTQSGEEPSKGRGRT